NDPQFATTMKKALEGKQPLNQTLTDLSGKTVAGILEYLGLGEAAKRSIGNGANQVPDMVFFKSQIGSNGYACSPSGYIL
ncbi:phage tail protein, partial [Enterobacter hormaechei]|nr:phage tail protein [Enterobacter hormaechei]